MQRNHLQTPSLPLGNYVICERSLMSLSWFNNLLHCCDYVWGQMAVATFKKEDIKEDIKEEDSITSKYDKFSEIKLVISEQISLKICTDNFIS